MWSRRYGGTPRHFSPAMRSGSFGRPRRGGAFHEVSLLVPVAGVALACAAVCRTDAGGTGVQFSHARRVRRNGNAVDAGKLSAPFRPAVSHDPSPIVSRGVRGHSDMPGFSLSGRALHRAIAAPSEPVSATR